MWQEGHRLLGSSSCPPGFLTVLFLPGGLTYHHSFQCQLHAEGLQLCPSPASTVRPDIQWASVTWPSLDSWWASIRERSFRARLRAETRAVPASSLFLITYQTAHQKKAHRLQFQNLLEAISLAMPLTLLARSKPRSDHLLTGCSSGLLAGAQAYLSASCSSPFTHSQLSFYHCFLLNVLQCPWPN